MTKKQLDTKMKSLNDEIKDAENEHQELLKKLQTTFKESSEKLDELKKILKFR